MTHMDLNNLSKNELAGLARLLDEQEKAFDDGKLELYEPHVGQEKFHKSNKKIRLVITGNRWGKTTASVIETIWLGLGIHPYHNISVPNKGKLYAVDFGQAHEVIHEKFREWVPKKFLNLKRPFVYNQHGYLVRVNFWNGSYVKIGTYDQSTMSAEGSNWNYVAFDEPPPRDLYIGNLRGLVDSGGIMWFTMTPLHEAWIYDELWVPGQTGGKKDKRVDCFTGNSFDNPHTNKESLDLFADELTQEEYSIRIEGNFTKLRGLVIDTYNPSLSDVNPFPLNSDFVLYEGIDPHPSKAHRALWKAVARDGRRYVVDELLCDGGIYDFGKQIAIIRRRLTERGAILCDSICDTSLNQKDPNFRINQRDELCRALRDSGEVIFPRNAQKKDWLDPGIAKLRDLYRPIKHVIDQGEGKEPLEFLAPMEYIFKSCRSYIYELMHYQYPNRDMLETTKPIAKDNDLIDCNRYIESIAPEYRTPGNTGIIHDVSRAYQRIEFEDKLSSATTKLKWINKIKPSSVNAVRYATRRSSIMKGQANGKV